MEEQLYREVQRAVSAVTGMANYLRYIYKIHYLYFGYNSDQDWAVWIGENNDRQFEVTVGFKVTEDMEYKVVAERFLKFIRN
jgi:hypothetical protein